MSIKSKNVFEQYPFVLAGIFAVGLGAEFISDSFWYVIKGMVIGGLVGATIEYLRRS